MSTEIKDLVHYSHNANNSDYVQYDRIGIKYSKQRVNYSLLIKHGCEFIKYIPCSFGLDNVSDSKLHSFSYNIRVMKYEDIYFLFDEIRFVVDAKNFNRGILLLLKLMAKYRMTNIPKKSSPRNKMSEVASYIRELYINEDTATELIAALTPFVATYEKRRQFKLNMCLGIILCGKPGDGKTYNGQAILRYIGNLIRLPYTQEEAVSFEKAAKLADDFVSLIDDMNVSHFRRSTGGAICANILSEMDKPNANRLFIFTTNEEINNKSIDSAFFRPGRVQHVIHVRKPDEKIKNRIIEDMVDSLSSYEIELDTNFITGVKLLCAEADFSLAEMINLRRLIITDKIMENATLTPQQYVEKCKSLKIEEEEVDYVNDDAISH